MAFTNVHLFFTLWVLLLMVFYKYTLEYFDMLYLVLIVFCIGCYVSFIDPRYYVAYVFGEEYKFEGLARFCCVDMIHLMLLMVVLCNKVFTDDRNIYKTLNSILLVIIYIGMIDPVQIYRTHNWRILYVTGIVITILYLLFLK